MYKEKYLKYKTKYLELKNQLDSYPPNIIQEGGGGGWWPWSSTKVVPVYTPPVHTMGKDVVFKKPDKTIDIIRAGTGTDITKKMQQSFSITEAGDDLQNKSLIGIEIEFMLGNPEKIIDIIRAGKGPDKTIEILRALPISRVGDDIKNIYLNIKMESILDTEFNALINGLKRNTTIKKLILSINKLSLQQYIELGNAIRLNNGLMTLVMFIINDKDTENIVLSELIKALKENRKLDHIVFANTLNEKAAVELKELIQHNENIKRVSFTNNNISERIQQEIKLLALFHHKTILLNLDQIRDNIEG
jgi:hypothetical protein